MLYGLNEKMQKVSLPPLSSGLQVSVAAREPPQRSWSRFKKVLIDNPKDSDLLHRQKLWNFQKLNRGAFRSHLSSLPDIPYRVHTNNAEKVSVSVQTNDSEIITSNSRILFPRLQARRDKICCLDSDDSDEEADGIRSDQRHKACSPIQLQSRFTPDYSDDFDDDSAVEDAGLEFDSVLKQQNAGTMTESKQKSSKGTRTKEKRKKSVKARNSVRSKEKPILKSTDEIERLRPPSGKKSVQFEEKDINQACDDKPNPFAIRKEKPLSPQIPNVPEHSEPKPDEGVLKLELSEHDRSVSSSDDSDDDVINVPLAKMGHSSHFSLDNLSILDLLSGSKTNRSRTVNKWEALTSRDENGRRQFSGETEANRIWFEQIVGDKEVIDVGTYESFARTRPAVETNNLSDTNDKYTEIAKSSTRKNLNVRGSDECPSYRQTLSKASLGKSSASSSTPLNRSRNTKRSVTVASNGK